MRPSLRPRWRTLQPDSSFAPAELTDEQKHQIYSAPAFLEFVESSSKIVQRALSDGYDYIKDYTLGGPGDMCARLVSFVAL